MTRVFVTSNRMRKRDGEIVPAVDLRPAEQFGSLTPVFDHAMDPTSASDIRIAQKRLDDFDDENDFVLPTGSPTATLATGMLLRKHGISHIQVLEWDRFTLRYNIRMVSL